MISVLFRKGMDKCKVLFLCAYLLVLSASLSACLNISLDPHEAFKNNFHRFLGKSIDNSSSFLTHGLVSSKKLYNGNIENKYRSHGTCHYYFEYDPKTKIIIGWRFTGKKEHCTLG